MSYVVAQHHKAHTAVRRSTEISSRLLYDMYKLLFYSFVLPNMFYLLSKGTSTGGQKFCSTLQILPMKTSETQNTAY